MFFESSTKKSVPQRGARRDNAQGTHSSNNSSRAKAISKIPHSRRQLQSTLGSTQRLLMELFCHTQHAVISSELDRAHRAGVCTLMWTDQPRCSAQLITTLARHAFSWSTPQAMQEVSLHDKGTASTRFTTSPSRALLPHTTCKHAGQESSSTAGSTGFFALRPLHENDCFSGSSRVRSSNQDGKRALPVFFE